MVWWCCGMMIWCYSDMATLFITERRPIHYSLLELYALLELYEGLVLAPEVHSVCRRSNVFLFTKPQRGDLLQHSFFTIGSPLWGFNLYYTLFFYKQYASLRLLYFFYNPSYTTDSLSIIPYPAQFSLSKLRY